MKGDAKAECQFWVSTERNDHGIHHSREIGDRDRRYNENLYVESDGFRLGLSARGMVSVAIESTNHQSPDEAARHYYGVSSPMALSDLLTCSACKQFIPDLLDSGIDALTLVQISASGTDPADLKAGFGDRLTF